jgi:hypothetical protein
MPEEPDSENYWADSNSNSCSHTQKELEDYRLQELAKDPYRIEREPDLYPTLYPTPKTMNEPWIVVLLLQISN